MKKVIKSILILFILLCVLVFLYWDATNLAPRRIQVRYETMVSEEIPEQLDNIQILFFSDSHLNQFVDQDRFSKLIQLIEDTSPDVILFGGDLFDHPANNPPSEEVLAQTKEKLASLKAPLGKFAVLGNHDLEAESTKELISQLLYQSGFEVLNNQAVRIRNHGSQSISLVGLESEMLGNPDPTTAFAAISPTDFTITLCHTPDTVLQLPAELSELMLAGHGHGGQVYLPVVGALYKAKYAEIYYRGQHQVNSTLLDITNGTGTTKMDVRFMAEAEVVVYRLSHAKPTPTAEPTIEPTPTFDDEDPPEQTEEQPPVENNEPQTQDNPTE